jgi:hypothetical protein
MKLTRAPRSVAHFSSLEHRVSGGELGGKLVDLLNEKSVGRSICGTEVLRVVPLKVELDVIAPDAHVLRVSFGVREDELEPESPIEANGRMNVAHQQDRVNRFEPSRHRWILALVKTSPAQRCK